MLDAVPEIEVMHLEKSYGFFSTLSDREKEEVHAMYLGLWNKIRKKTLSGGYDMLVIDEFMAAYNYGLIPHEEALQFLKEKPEALEIVLTGRNPEEARVELAD